MVFIMSTRLKRCLYAPFFVVLAFLAACVPSQTESERANAVFDELFMESLRESTEYMAYLGMR